MEPKDRERPLRIRRFPLSLLVRRPAQLIQWIGPALKSLTNGRLKAQVCRHPEAERLSRWKYCKGCSFLNECSYGLFFEPENDAPASSFHSRQSAPRPVVLAPYFPVVGPIQADHAIPVCLTVIGVVSEDHVNQLLEAIADVGRAPGLGPDKVPFDLLVEENVQDVDLFPIDLPSHPADVPGVLPRVTVQLSSPLLLKHGTEVPSFSDLLRASFRVLGSLFANHAEELPADFKLLKSAAEGVELVECRFEHFDQPKWSSRQSARYIMRGVQGYGTYSDVPLSLLPWLIHGGRLHVGDRRVDGAGGWRVILD